MQSNYSDRSPQYLFSYSEALRLDAEKRKRPEKLKCKPGYEQRGAACQKAIKSNNANQGGGAGIVGAALLGGAAIAAGGVLAANRSKSPESSSPLGSAIESATQQYNKTPTWQKAALVGAIATATPPAAYMATRARYRSGFKESARMAEEKAKSIEVKKVKDREHTIIFGIGGKAYADESPEVRSGQRIVRAASMAFSQDKGKDFKLVPVDNTAGNIPEGVKKGSEFDQQLDAAKIFYRRMRDGRSQAAVDLAANVIAWSDANPDKQIVLMGHSSGGYDVHEAQEILRIARPDLEKRIKSFSFGTGYFGLTDKFGESHTITSDKDPYTNGYPVRDRKNFKDSTHAELSPEAHTQGAYFSNEEVKKFVTETIYKDADKYKKEPANNKSQKKQKSPKNKTDSAEYILNYANALRLDRKKRPEKLKCRPGYEQRGAACQKVSRSIKPSVNPGDIAKLAIGAALVGGAGVVAARHLSESSSQKPDREPIKELIEQPVEQLTKKIVPKVAPAAALVGGTAAAYMALDARYKITDRAAISAYENLASNKEIDDWVENSNFSDDQKKKISGLVGATKTALLRTTYSRNGGKVVDIDPKSNSFTYKMKDGSLMTVGSVGSRVFTFGSKTSGGAGGFPVYEMGFKINDSFDRDAKTTREQAVELIRMTKTAYATHLEHLPDNAFLKAEPWQGDNAGNKRKSIYEKEGFRELPIRGDYLWALKNQGNFTSIPDEQVEYITKIIKGEIN